MAVLPGAQPADLCVCVCVCVCVSECVCETVSMSRHREEKYKSGWEDGRSEERHVLGGHHGGSWHGHQVWTVLLAAPVGSQELADVQGVGVFRVIL